jgi:hypothetical protein
VAREMGYSLAELVGTDSKPKRAPVAPKYQHPDNPAITWSGRGRKPQWFVDALAAGTTAGDLEIRSEFTNPAAKVPEAARCLTRSFWPGAAQEKSGLIWAASVADLPPSSDRNRRRNAGIRCGRIVYLAMYLAPPPKSRQTAHAGWLP